MGLSKRKNARTFARPGVLFSDDGVCALRYFLSRVVTNFNFAGKINSISNHTLLYV